jgi:hypothetical protein
MKIPTIDTTDKRLSTQPTKVKVVGTFHVPSTENPGKS